MMIFMGLYIIVDIIFVLRFININVLLVINIVCLIINFIVGIGIMFVIGGSVIVVCKMGNGDIEGVNKVFFLIVLLGVVIGVIIIGIGIVFMDYIIIWLGVSEVLIKYCCLYFFIILVFVFVNIL